MTAKELLAYQIQDVGRQLKACFENMPEPVWNQKLYDEGFTPRVAVEHLCEAYAAVSLDAAGEKYEWGTFKLETDSIAEMLGTLWAMRQKASDAVTRDDDRVLKAGAAYIVSHDAYHVGQLAAIRVAHDSAWDPYSIYQE